MKGSYLARTGYTGEDGFEIMLPAEAAPGLWSGLVDLGASSCGLGARDVLRLEAGLLASLATDMSTDIDPYEAELDRFVDADREDYVAGAALRGIRDTGPSRRIVGFRMLERGIARQGYAILDDNGQETIGWVTSGGPSPTLDMNIGLGYVPIRFAESGSPNQNRDTRPPDGSRDYYPTLLSAEKERMNPADLSYSKEHEWVRMESDDVAVVGITEFAQDSLGDVVFVELPEVEAEVGQFEKMGEIESVKAVSDLYSPVSGSVLERNEALVDSPELVNDSPYEEGWMLRLAVSDSSEMGNLMSASEYEAFLESEDQGH